MEIDLVTVAAQIFNFALLVWLLNRFLYRPIVNVISARENAVKERLQEAERLQEEARRQLAAYEAQREELDETRERYLKEAREEARRVRSDLLQQAEAEAENERRRLQEQLAAEKRELAESLQESIIRQAGDVARRLLRDMGGRDIGDGVIAALGRKMAENEELLTKIELPVTVRLSFEPTPEQADRVRTMIGQTLNMDLSEDDVQVVHDETLLLGAEVHYDGTVLTWHARHYVNGWEEEAVRLAAGEDGGERHAIDT